MNVNWKRIQSVILSLTCHSLINFPPLMHIPSYAFMNFWNPTIYYFLSLSHLLKVECELENNSLNIFICHLSFLKKLSPTHKHSLVCIHEFLKTYELYFFEFESFEKRWNVNWKNIPSIILFVTCHSLRNFPPLIHISPYPFINLFETLQVIISCVWVIHKGSNVNWKKNSLNNVICHLSWF